MSRNQNAMYFSAKKKGDVYVDRNAIVHHKLLVAIRTVTTEYYLDIMRHSGEKIRQE